MPNKRTSRTSVERDRATRISKRDSEIVEEVKSLKRMFGWGPETPDGDSGGLLIKILILILFFSSRYLGFTRGAIFLTGEVSLENLLEKLLHLQGVGDGAIAIVEATFRVMLLTTALTLLLPEARKLYGYLKVKLGINKRIACFLLILTYLLVIFAPLAHGPVIKYWDLFWEVPSVEAVAPDKGIP